jgi:hypothetical protein
MCIRTGRRKRKNKCFYDRHIQERALFDDKGCLFTKGSGVRVKEKTRGEFIINDFLKDPVSTFSETLLPAGKFWHLL